MRTNKKYPLPWDALANLSSDVPKINRKIMAVIGYQVERNRTQGLVTIHKLYNPCCAMLFTKA